MLRAFLFGLLLAASATAQLTMPARPGQPAPAYPILADGFLNDSAMWTGPLMPAPGDAEAFRTFGVGSLAGARREYVPNGVLVGFEFTAHNSQRAISVMSLQPFYASGGRRYSGAAVGTAMGGRIQLIAREGYAVRSVSTAFGGALTGFQVTFARLQEDGTLSGTDTYASPAYGQPVYSLDGGGLPFSGVMANGSRSVHGLALLVSQATVNSRQPALVPVQRGQLPAAGAIAASPVTYPPLPPGVTPIGGAVPTVESPAPQVPASFAPPAAAMSTIFADGQIGELVRSAGDNLVFVEGTDGQGSGFLCNLQGKRVLITNQHVINGNPNARFSTVSTGAVKVGAAHAAAGHDLIAYDAPEAASAFDPASDFVQTVLVGDDVVVLGNTEGARVIKPLPGRIVGIGRELVEISSEFLPGNSGSPIVHLKTGRVIGVATYALIRKVNSLTGANEESVRRFGYRLDSVQNWQPVQWPIYQAEAAATKKVSDFSSAIIQLLIDVRGGRFDGSRHRDSRLQPAVAQLNTLVTRRNINQIDRARIVQNFLGELRNVAQRDVELLRPQLRYDYFQREIAEEAKFRAEIHAGLGEAIRNLR